MPIPGSMETSSFDIDIGSAGQEVNVKLVIFPGNNPEARCPVSDEIQVSCKCNNAADCDTENAKHGCLNGICGECSTGADCDDGIDRDGAEATKDICLSSATGPRKCTYR